MVKRTLEILARSKRISVPNDKFVIIMPKDLRRKIGLEKEDQYSFLAVEIKDPSGEYDGVRGVLVYPVQLYYSPKKEKNQNTSS